MELKHILAATDFSPGAERAVERASSLASQHGATLHLLHVLPQLSWKMFGRTLVEHPLVTEKNLYQAARERLDNLADVMQERCKIPVQSFVDIGRPYERIAAYVTDHKIDMTVLGSHAGNLARDLFVGSTAGRFLRRGGRSALVASPSGGGSYERVLVAIDFSDVSRTAVDAATEIAPNATIHLLHVYDVMFEGKMLYANVDERIIQQYRDAADAEAWRMMDAFVTTLPRHERFVAKVRSGSPARTILSEAEALRADLIVMGKRGRSELNELFLGSVSENVVHESSRDLLLVAE